VPQALPLDQLSFWDGATAFVFNTAAAPAGTQRLSSATGTNYWVWDASVGGLRNWRGFGQTGGLAETQSAAVKDATIFPRGRHVFGPDYSHDFTYNTFTTTVDQRFGRNLNVQLVANVTADTNYRKQTTDNSIRRDPNLTLPGGAANPNYGRYYLEYSWDSRRAHHYIPEGRLNIVYDWQPADWMKQRLFASAGLREEVFNNQVQREVIVNNPTFLPYNNQSLLVRRRVYLAAGDDVANTGTIDPIVDAATGLRAEFLTTQNAAINTTYSGNAQLNASGEYLDGKFRTLFGVRRDYARSYSQTGFREASTGLINRGDAPELLRFEGYNTSLTAGGIWQPTRHYTFFATAAESYRPTGFGNTLINGEPVGAQLGRGHEGGARVDFADGRFYVQASVFQARQSNRGTNLNTTITTINNIWTNAAANAVRPDYANKATTGGTFDREAVESTGHEIEVWWNLVPGWTLQAGYGYADAETVETSAYTRGYIAATLADWKSTAAVNATTASALNPLIASLESFLATAVPGSKTIGSSRESFSLFTKYTLQGGPLKNLDLGIGLNHRSGPVVYNEVVAGVVRPVHGERTTVLNLLVGYSRRLSDRIRWNISLNVQNALDEDYFVELSRSQVTYGDPLSWAVTNTFSF
jgi:outer membrane receptor for ferric coprogen and ferric-rhodotorulic acid